MPPKKRLDSFVLEKRWAASRQRAQAMIMAGKIMVNRQIVDKPGRQVSGNDEVTIQGKDIPYVSRGGLKIEEALRKFQVDVTGWVCMDVGASTGGFTDCLRQNGAEHVYAIDVGYGQLAWKLRSDPRVTVMERTNVRYMPLEKIPFPVDIAAIDVSFISLRIVVPAVLKFLKPRASIIALIKPQFEVGKDKIGKGGVVKDTRLHQEVVDSLSAFFNGVNLSIESVIPSPLKGPKGNLEFLIHLKWGNK